MSATGQPSAPALSLSGNLRGVVLSEVGLVLPEQISFEQWQSVGRELSRLQRASTWWIGDWWRFAEERPTGGNWTGDRKALVESQEWAGPAFQTCRNAASVCRAFQDTSRRRDMLSFRHHAEVSSLPFEEADRLLAWCEEPIRSGVGKPRTIRQLRQELIDRGLRSAKNDADDLPDVGTQDAPLPDAEDTDLGPK